MEHSCPLEGSLEGSGGGAQLLTGGVRRWNTAARWRGPWRGQEVEHSCSLEGSGGGAQLLARGGPWRGQEVEHSCSLERSGGRAQLLAGGIRR